MEESNVVIDKKNKKEPCPFCKKPSVAKCTVPIWRMTESESLINVDNTDEEMISVVVPFCRYHLEFAVRGQIVTADKRLFILGQKTLDNCMDMSDQEIRELINECEGKPDLSMGVEALKTYLIAKEHL